VALDLVEAGAPQRLGELREPGEAGAVGAAGRAVGEVLPARRGLAAIHRDVSGERLPDHSNRVTASSGTGG
jgi:hypothetical protein